MNTKHNTFFAITALCATLLCVALPAQAQLTLSQQYHFRHTDSRYNNDRHNIGVIASSGASAGTTATASQGTVNLPMADAGGGEFFVSIPYDPTLTGSWQITAQNGADTQQVLTNDIVGVGPMPFVQNLTSTGGLPTPTLSWTLPVTTEPFTQTRVRLYDASTNNQIGGTFSVGLDTTFTVPAGLLDSSGRYNFRVMLENVASNVLVNRSSTYTSLPAPGVIHGQVYQFDDVTPIGNATVEALGVSSGTPYMTTTATDATGGYSLTLPVGSYRVRAAAPGYAREYFDNVNPSNQATVLDVINGSNTVANFSLNEGGSITGHIYQSDGLTPIPNARLLLIPSLYYGDDGFRVTSSTDGSYFIDNLSLGQYKMEIEADGFALKYYEDGFYWDTAKNINVIPPSTTTGIDVTMLLEASISGHVFATDGATPIPGVLVVADGLGFGGAGASTNDGSYVIRGMRADTYRLRVDFLPGWYAGEFYDSKPSRNTANLIDIKAGDHIADIDFTLDEGGAITGRVFDQESGRTIPDAAIFAVLPNGEDVTPIGKVDITGKYRINLKPGTYYLRAWGEIVGYLSEWYQDASDFGSATPVAVGFRQETSGIDLSLSRPGSISGQVFEIDGVTPIAGANVFAFPVGSQTGSGANTGPDGRYKIEGLVSGSYVAWVTVTGHVAGNEPADVTAPNETPNVNFTLATYPYTVIIIGQNVVGEQGGGVRVSDTSSPLLGAGVDIPSGALSDYTVISIGEVNAPAFPSNLIGIGAPVHFGPEGLQFARSVTLILPYRQADLDNAGISDPNQLDVYTFNTTTQAWEKVLGSKTVDPNNHVVMIAVDHFSIFRLGVLQSSPPDTTPPVLSLPDDITAEATDTLGAAVTYTASAMDDVDGPITPTCAPPSGSTFPVGTTTVQCSVTDGAGNTASGAFKVMVSYTAPPGTASTFDAFKVDWLNINRRLKTFFLMSRFTLGSDSDGIDPATEPVTLAIGDFTATIPAGRFRKGSGPVGAYAFAGKINQVAIEALIVPLGNNRFRFQAAAYGADFNGTTNPVAVSLMIGNDSGETSVNAVIR